MNSPRPQIVVLIGLAMAALVLGTVLAMRVTAESTRPWAAGDCLAVKAPDGFDRVACSSRATTHRIVAVQDDQPRPVRFRYPCGGVTDADWAYWQGADPDHGRVFCLNQL